ncbi:MAG: VCBS repeat-containing protein [Cyclobacteriaceae bacterium]
MITSHSLAKSGLCTLLFTAVLVWVSSCDEVGKDDKRFLLLSPSESGIEFENKVDHLPNQNIIEYLYHYNGAGVAIGDVNNDGLEDVYLSANQGPDHLYLNQGNLRFNDVSLQAGISNTEGWSTGVTMADVNADGWLDIYVCQVGGYKSYVGKNLLFINNQDGTFSESAADYGLSFTGFFTQAAFFDYDLDGDLDAFLMNHAVHTPRSYRPVDQYLPRDFAAGDYLLKNELDSLGSFIDVTEEAGIIANLRGYGLGLAVADIDEDGWPDIYVGNDFHENDYLYINNKDGSFSEQLRSRVPHTSQFSMGVDIQDVNGDGLADIFTADMMPKDRGIRMKSGGEDPYKLKEAKFSFGFHPQIARNTLQINKGSGVYADIASMSGLFATDWSWSVLLEDLDNSGRTDVFISNGIYRRPNDLDYINFLSNYDLTKYSETAQDSIEKILIEKMPSLKIPNAVFSQESELEFVEKSKKWGLDEAGYSGATAVADFDLDGDLDLIVNNLNQPAWLFENKSSVDTNRHFLTVKVTDKKSSPAVGSRVTVFSKGYSWSKQLHPTRGFQASSTHLLHFGLGHIGTIDSIQIQWQGREQTVRQVAVDQVLNVSTSEFEFLDAKRDENEVLITAQALKQQVQHASFLDYNQEPLMPYRLSLNGNPHLLADFDNDGTDELFVGGGKGISGVIYKVDEQGGLIETSDIVAFDLDAFYEDVSCVAADFDGDGFLDLYVASGGNRYPERSKELEDRLYFGDGKLNFRREKKLFPTTNASVVIVEDYDADGDPDLFVGTSNFPGAYGYGSPSFLIENKGNGNLNVQHVINAGMVRDATWFKEEGASPKLAIVSEWESLKVWSFSNGRPYIDSLSREFDDVTGWFRSVAAADLNEDGKIDFVMGNIGLNTTLTASKDLPVKLYVNDFDENGQTDPIVSFYLEGKEIPLASKDMLTSQLPALKKQYFSYQEFAEMDNVPSLLGTMYREESVLVKDVNELGHIMYLSSDSGYHQVRLPKELQMSPINHMVIDDFNQDNVLDLLTGGNLLDHFSMIGQLDANAISLSLGGKKDGVYMLSHKAFVLNEDQHIRFLGRTGARSLVAIPLEGPMHRLRVN